MRRDLPNLHDLLAFETAARARNFTQAAELLNVQQPAVSRRVAQLEDWLGAALFHRRGSQLSLTPAGERLQAAARAGLDEIERAISALRQEARRPLLTVDVSIAFASCWLIKRLGAFRAQRPDIDVQLISRYTNTVPPSTSSAVVVYFRDAEQDHAGQRPVLLEHLVVVCSAGFLERAGGAIRPDALGRFPLLILNEAPHLDDWRKVLGSQGPAFAAERAFNNFVVYLKAVMNGEGLGLAWHELVADELATGALVRPVAASHRSERGYYVYLREGSESDPAAQAFVDWLVLEGAASSAPAGRDSPTHARSGLAGPGRSC